MLSQINSEIAARLSQLRREFETAQPFRHVVMDRFLAPEFCRNLVAEFPRFEAGHSVNERGEAGKKSVNPRLASIGPAYSQFDRLMRGAEFLSFTTGIANLLYDPEYVGGGTHENLNGQDLDSHVDFNYHPSRGWHRRLNLIVFLNREWATEWGGCLELLRDPLAPAPANCIVSVTPLENRAVLFETTERSWHGFRRIEVPEERSEISRRSIAVYFYTKERPAEETEVSHGTVYYQRPLPERIEAGYGLNEPDVEELQILLARRDTQIKFLYERELEFSNALEKMRGSTSFRIGRALTWPVRAAGRLVRR